MNSFLLSLIFFPLIHTHDVPPLYDYIVIGSGPGGGPLASRLAQSNSSVLLLEAGSDSGYNIHEEVAGLFFLAYQDPTMRWDFFVKYHSNDSLTLQYEHLTWRTSTGEFYVGTEPPEGAEMLGVWYPRSGTLGGCSAHNALCASYPSDDLDWGEVEKKTGDESWSPANMRKYFERIEHNNYLPPGTPGHGFSGYLDISVNDDETLRNQTEAQGMLQGTAKALGEDPNNLFTLLQRDLNTASPTRDKQTGFFGFPAHRNLQGRRVSSRTPIVSTLDARDENGKKKYPLTLQLESLVTKILFDTASNETFTSHLPPKAIGVEYLAGKSMYSADPRYNASINAPLRRAYARKEIILSAGVFNSPQLLKLSGLGPASELTALNIPVLVDIPGIGANLQDNTEFSIIARTAKNFTNIAPACTLGAPGDPCLSAWEMGLGPYTTGPLDAIMLQTSVAENEERDLFLWATNSRYRGYWPSETINHIPVDTPNTWNFPIIKMHPRSAAGTVNLKSSNPRDMPEINFRFFEEDKDDLDLRAMKEGVEFGRKVFQQMAEDESEFAPFEEVLPCMRDVGIDGGENCDVLETIRTQTWSHHGTSTCAIGGERDKMAVLDSRFRVRGTRGLRVVDGSAFPRTPGGFPIIPTFMLAEKGADVILEDNA